MALEHAPAFRAWSARRARGPCAYKWPNTGGYAGWPSSLAAWFDEQKLPRTRASVGARDAPGFGAVYAARGATQADADACVGGAPSLARGI